MTNIWKWLAIGVIIVLILAGSGLGYSLIRTSNELETTKSSLGNTKSELGNTKSGLAAAQSQVIALQTKITTLQNNLTLMQPMLKETQDKLDTTNSQLADIQKVYPPKNFPSISAVSDWASKHIQRPTIISPWNLYTSALTVQEQALEDGYIVSATFCAAISPANISTWVPGTNSVVILEAITADGTPCWWNPVDGGVNSWPPSIFPR